MYMRITAFLLSLGYGQSSCLSVLPVFRSLPLNLNLSRVHTIGYLFHAEVVYVSRRLCSFLVLILRVELIIWLCRVFIYCSFSRRSFFWVVLTRLWIVADRMKLFRLFLHFGYTHDFLPLLLLHYSIDWFLSISFFISFFI